MNELLIVGLSHKTAPLDLRERCGVGDGVATLRELREFAPEAALVTTCNRFEVYLYGADDPAPVLGWIAARAGVPAEEMEAHCYVRRGRNACKHLFFVASSLDSLVVGETQIRGQVKRAYTEAQEAETVGVHFHRLFQAALRVSKEISDSTGVGRGNVSVAGAAADLAERVFGELTNASVVVIGAGETAELVMNHLSSRGVSRFGVFNRSAENAARLAERLGARSGGLDQLEAHLFEADVLVSAAGDAAPLVTRAQVLGALRRRRGRPMVAIDISVPRGIDPAIDELDNVYRFDMDALTAVTQDAFRHRREDFLQCCTLVDSATLRLYADTRAQRAGTAIAELEEAYQRIAESELEELERRMEGLGSEEREQVRRAIHRIVRKLLHMPVRAIRSGDPDEQEVIRRVFSSGSGEGK